MVDLVESVRVNEGILIQFGAEKGDCVNITVVELIEKVLYNILQNPERFEGSLVVATCLPCSNTSYTLVYSIFNMGKVESLQCY